MAKSGTTMATGNAMRSASTSGVRHGPNVKHVVNGGTSSSAKSQGSKIPAQGKAKGSDRGGF